MSPSELDIQRLSPEQKLRLIEELWDSLVQSHGPPPLTGPQKRELERRSVELDSGRMDSVPADDAMSQIRRRRGQ